MFLAPEVPWGVWCEKRKNMSFDRWLSDLYNTLIPPLSSNVPQVPINYWLTPSLPVSR